MGNGIVLHFQLLFETRVKRQLMPLYYHENSFDLTDAPKGSQGLPGVHGPATL